jgi:hypothetical protein
MLVVGAANFPGKWIQTSPVLGLDEILSQNRYSNGWQKLTTAISDLSAQWNH